MLLPGLGFGLEPDAAGGLHGFPFDLLSGFTSLDDVILLFFSLAFL